MTSTPATRKGASFVELTIDEKGRRASTYEAYLKPAMQRPNLAVVTNALDPGKVVVENGRATGVEYEVEGEVLSRKRPAR